MSRIFASLDGEAFDGVLAGKDTCLGSEDEMPVVNTVSMSLYLRGPRSGAIEELGQLGVNLGLDLMHFG